MKERRSTRSRERMLSEFRVRGICNLGRVQRAYLEANGSCTVLQFDHDRDGLCILPSWDDAFRQELETRPALYCCRRCGELPTPTPKEIPWHDYCPC